MLGIFLVVPWIVSALTAWWYTETNGSVIKKYDASLYEEIKNDKEGKKIEELKKTLAEKKKLLEASEKKLEQLKKIEEDDLTDDDKTEIEELENNVIPGQKQKVEIAESADGKLWMPVLSLSNIGWFLGIFLVLGIIGHFITKKILGMFSENKE